VRVLVRANAIREKLLSDRSLTFEDIAKSEGIVPSYATRLFRLTVLAPDIVSAILNGRHPPDLTARRLMDDTRLPLDWNEQRRSLGFAPSNPLGVRESALVSRCTSCYSARIHSLNKRLPYHQFVQTRLLPLIAPNVAQIRLCAKAVMARLVKNPGFSARNRFPAKSKTGVISTVYVVAEGVSVDSCHFDC
jgi:hypothetical protein